MKLHHAEDFNEMSPTDIIDTTELDFNEEEKRIFSDAVLLAQQYNKYVKDFKSGKMTVMTNKDNITWFRRFIYDAFYRRELIARIDNPLLNKILGLIEEMKELDLKFLEECLQIDNLYEKTIENISGHSISSFYDLRYFVGECTETKKKHIIEKIDKVPENLSNLIMF
ncbi:MAG: hypothetical protein JW825_02725 [Candidatus Methanofastidiosa archaeon]|nr:hypothetical protein [Candidatus Methanofastidiosa archaeon]